MNIITKLPLNCHSQGHGSLNHLWACKLIELYIKWNYYCCEQPSEIEIKTELICTHVMLY